MEKLKNLSNNLEKIRKSENISLGSFSKKLELPATTLWDLVNKNNTSLQTLIWISEKLEIPIDVLLSEDMHIEEQNLVLKIVRHIEVLSEYTYEQQLEICGCILRIFEIMNRERNDVANDINAEDTYSDYAGDSKGLICV